MAPRNFAAQCSVLSWQIDIMQRYGRTPILPKFRFVLVQRDWMNLRILGYWGIEFAISSGRFASRRYRARSAEALGTPLRVSQFEIEFAVLSTEHQALRYQKLQRIDLV